MTRMTWIAAAVLAVFVAAPALADSRQTTEDQPGNKGGSQGSNGQQGDQGGDQSQDKSDNSQASQPTMKDLLAAGYEVKSTMLVPRDVVKRGGATDSIDAVMIVLQNGAALATCYEAFSSDAFLGDPTALGCTEFK